MSNWLDTLKRSAAIQTVSLTLFRFIPWRTRVWVLGQMALARLSLRRQPGLRFWKLCGSGTGEGFTPRPNTQVWAILAVWDDETTAREGVAASPVFRRWARRADEACSFFLSATSVRGQWSGEIPFHASDPDHPPGSPIAALTRATVDPRVAARFWRRVPNISAAIGQDPNVIFKIGIGEVPLLHQVTFSIWPDARSMANFARSDGPHARAINAVRDGNWFREELYARFRVLHTAGTWDGRAPLAAYERTAA